MNMNLNKAIGGYLELELGDNGSIYHDSAYKLNSGRNALEFILINKRISKIYLPYYICDVVLQPVQKRGIAFEFYHIDESFKPKIGQMSKNSGLIYVNYFGLCTNNIKNILRLYKNVIIDNSQAFFSKHLEGAATFYSPRKFWFGRMGFAYVNDASDETLVIDNSMDRMNHLLTRIELGLKQDC